MPTSALTTFASVLSSFRGHFTAPTFVRFVILAVGWILACDPSAGGCVTEALVAAQVSGSMHWEAFHRFFSRARWDPDALGKTLFHLLGPLLSLSCLELALDDTAPLMREGALRRFENVFGGANLDPKKYEETIPQALFLINGQGTNKGGRLQKGNKGNPIQTEVRFNFDDVALDQVRLIHDTLEKARR